MLIQFEEYRNKLSTMRQPLSELGAALKLDQARNEVEKLEEESAQEGFWNDCKSVVFRLRWFESITTHFLKRRLMLRK